MKKLGWYDPFIKRFIDLICAIFILLFLSWLLALIYLWIKFDSKGPAIFKQERVGINGKSFICYKFRTMLSGTQNLATHEVPSSQVTKSGRFLRATKFDELPQAWNIILNNMSMVGPRPCLPSQTELIKERNDRGVLTIKPGITGLSQIKRINMSTPIKLAICDAKYLETRSILLDIKIMLLTVLRRPE